jgi:cupin superfamily acireductone dioxygenase involved in methionine salvage
MRLYDLKSFYIVTDIKEHKKNKDKLLSLIDGMEKSSIDNVSKTDWNLPKETKRQYKDLFYKMIEPYLNEMTDKLKFKSCKINNIWYQSYEKNSTHEWHVHPEVNYTNVYYLDLPDETIKTQLYDIRENKIINIELKEGQLFTFPANILHRSPINTSNNVKTIISFNTNFDDYIGDNNV